MRFLVLCFALLASLPAAAAELRPNVIFILVDDMGYADTGPFGNTYHKTPHIDRLAAEGMRFTDAYAAAPNCSPTRASILTGKWPARTGVTQYLPGNHLPFAKLKQADLPPGLPLDETILPQALNQAGYATASIGKWHLGGDDYLPERRGFDLNFAGGPWGHHQTMFAPYAYPEIRDSQAGEYLTDRLTTEAEKFIESNRDRPFFLYLPHYAIHSPIEAKKQLIDGYAGRPDPTGREDRVYAAMVEGLDQSVGRLTKKLEDLGISDRTILFFFSDNGGVERRAFNGGYRSGKGWLYEGGIREPLIVKWPGKVRPGTLSHTPVSSIDFYPTILEMAGVKDVDGHQSDGVSLAPLLQGGLGWERETLYWHYPHYSNAGGPPTGAIRRGDWKLIEFFEDGNVELYDLRRDASETTDLSRVHPGKAADLRAALAHWRQIVGAKPAPPNPDYDPAQASKKTPVPGDSE